MSLSLTIQFASIAKTLPARAQVRRWALAADRAAAGEATIRYVDEKEGRVLNRDFRGKDYATNVLTFVHELRPSPIAEGVGSNKKKLQSHHPLPNPLPRGERISYFYADIVVCAPVIFREAREQNKSVHEHHAHMVVHGMLHAQGFDHENDADATLMESLEVKILHRFRIKNPYDDER
jgi:probable rRNA maturation factor